MTCRHYDHQRGWVINSGTGSQEKLPTAQRQQLLQQGFDALQCGDLDQASLICQRLLKVHPKLVQGHFLVGLTALAGKDNKMALRAFGSVTQLQPQHAAAWAHLAQIFFKRGQNNRADKALQKAIENDSGDEPAVHNLIAMVLAQQGEQLEADAWYRKAVMAEPENAAFQINHANNLAAIGSKSDARQALNKALLLQPRNAQAHWVLAGLEKADSRTHVEQMQQLLDSGTETDTDAHAFLNYGVGKELEDLEDWSAAFAAFSRGASAKRRRYQYDEAKEHEAFDVLRERYTREWLDEGGEGHVDASPIFVVGQPRTGTTLLERIISSHSAVSAAGELQHFGNCLRRLSLYEGRSRFSPELFDMAVDVDRIKLGKQYLHRCRKVRGETPFFIDRLPNNYLLIPFILAALPKAKIVHLVRDPRDVCLSVYKRLFADAYKYSYDQGELARHIVRYHHLMTCWRERFPERFYDIAYEDLALDMKPAMQQLFQYLELGWEPQNLDFYSSRHAVSTLERMQEPSGTHSIGLWRHYVDQLQPAMEVLSKAGVLPSTEA